MKLRHWCAANIACALHGAWAGAPLWINLINLVAAFVCVEAINREGDYDQRD